MSVSFSKEEILDMLREGTVNLSFTKVKDGGVREMKATLVSDQIPEDKRPKTDKAPNNEEVACRVFDLDVNEWRSFRYDSLLTFLPE
jgi:hypothetical protein